MKLLYDFFVLLSRKTRNPARNPRHWAATPAQHSKRCGMMCCSHSLRGRRDRGTAAGNSSHPVIQKISNNEALITFSARIEMGHLGPCAIMISLFAYDIIDLTVISQAISYA